MIPAQGAAPPVIFLEPREITSSGGDFLLDDSVEIVLPRKASAEDAALANALKRDLADRFSVYPKQAQVKKVGAGSCQRIHNQLERYRVDVIGCYGMEFS